MQLFNAMTAETNSKIYVALGTSVSWIITAKATDRLKKQPTHGQTHTRPCIWFTLTKRHCRMVRLICDWTQRRRILSMPMKTRTHTRTVWLCCPHCTVHFSKTSRESLFCPFCFGWFSAHRLSIQTMLPWHGQTDITLVRATASLGLFGSPPSRSNDPIPSLWQTWKIPVSPVLLFYLKCRKKAYLRNLILIVTRHLIS